MKGFIFLIFLSLLSCGETTDDKATGTSGIVNNVFSSSIFENDASMSAFTSEELNSIQEICASLEIKKQRSLFGSGIQKNVKFARSTCRSTLIKDKESALTSNGNGFVAASAASVGQYFQTFITHQTSEPPFDDLCSQQPTNRFIQSNSNRMYRVDVVSNSKRCFSSYGYYNQKSGIDCIIFHLGEKLEKTDQGYVEGKELYKVILRNALSIETKASSAQRGFVKYQYLEKELSCPNNANFTVEEEVLL